MNSAKSEGFDAAQALVCYWKKARYTFIYASFSTKNIVAQAGTHGKNVSIQYVRSYFDILDLPNTSQHCHSTRRTGGRIECTECLIKPFEPSTQGYPEETYSAKKDHFKPSTFFSPKQDHHSRTWTTEKDPIKPFSRPCTKKRGRPPELTKQTPAMARSSARNRAEGGGDGENGEQSLPAELRRQDGEVSVTPVGSDDENDNEDEDEDDNSEAHGERVSRFLKKAFKEVTGTTPKAAKGKRGQPKGGWKKKTNVTPTRKSPRSTRKSAKLSAKKTSEDYALTSDPGADPIVGTAAEDTPAKGTRGRKRASLADEVDEEEEAPPPKTRGRPPNNRAEQPSVGRARLLQG